MVVHERNSADANTHTDSDSCSEPNAYSHPKTISDANPDASTHSVADSNANSGSNTYAHSYMYSCLLLHVSYRQ
jgi:hypothetical protein